MFDRYIRLAKARKALREQRFEDALELAADPLIQVDRRAEDVRNEARGRLLARARQRLADGDLAAARAELVRLRAVGMTPEVESLTAAVESARTTDEAAVAAARRSLEEARRALLGGETATAGSLLAAIGTDHLLLERQQLRQLLAERQRQAAEQRSLVEASLAAGAVDVAMQQFVRAEALDRESPELAALRGRLLAAAARGVDAAVAQLVAAGDLQAAMSRLRAAQGEMPALVGSDSLRAVAARLQPVLHAQLAAAAGVDEALRLARSVRAAEVEVRGPVGDLVECLLRADSLRGSTDAAAVWVQVQRTAAQVGLAALAAAAGELSAAGEAQAGRLAEARALLVAGDLDRARVLLSQLLAEQPMHEAARRELDLVDQGFADLDRRLEAVRSAARAGRLREACTGAMALTGSARAGADAQLVVAEARARMAVVDRGLDEVRVALHGRAAASVEGVRHCLLRLQELAKVQVDHEELPRVALAVEAEIEALEAYERALAAVQRQALPEVLAVVGELLSMRERLLAPDRLDARLCTLGDHLARVGDGALAAGRLGQVDRCAEALARMAVVREEFAGRAQRLQAARLERQRVAESLVDEARLHLAQRDLAEAERLAEQAQVQWAEGVTVRALAEELAELRQQSDVLAKVESLTRERDFRGANQKLAEMPPTPALLRTRIFDMKQNLARAQGLEGTFLLRVDEGGEHLVVRGETVSIGNVRQTRSDLPVLANVAGRHATIRRSMSFHGGMQDTVVAEEGEVRVAGEVVTTRRLATGDRVQLGPAFAFLYQQPSSRSLTVGLHLQGAFQVAGTDRVLLMKDRGRDGRILLGAGRDVHVRVAKATSEVEVFTTNTGQMRVACEAGGTIDGAPFRGEHPVAAGQVVEAAGISFVLLPWRPTV